MIVYSVLISLVQDTVTSCNSSSCIANAVHTADNLKKEFQLWEFKAVYCIMKWNIVTISTTWDKAAYAESTENPNPE